MAPNSPAVPRIFDRPLWRARLARAAHRARADFLLARVAEDAADRLGAIKRDFGLVLDLGTPGPQVAALLAGLPHVGRVIHAGPLPLAGGIVADEESLPFAPAVVDAIVSGLAFHGANDLPGVLVQARHALKPDGLLLAALPGGETLKELRASLTQAEIELTGGVSPRVAPFADLRDLGGLLQRAGFALPVTDVDTLTVRYPHLFALMADLRAMGATNILAERSRRFATRNFFGRAAQIYAERFADADGRIRATFEIVWLTGWVPHESQQKPLKPGSAKMRLADALNVREHKS